MNIINIPLRFYGSREFEHRPFAHSIAEIVCRAPLQNRRQQLVLPIVIMREPAQRCLDASNHYRHVRKQFFQYLRVYAHGVVRPLAGTSVRSVGIIVAQALGGSVMVHH